MNKSVLKKSYLVFCRIGLIWYFDPFLFEPKHVNFCREMSIFAQDSSYLHDWMWRETCKLSQFTSFTLRHSAKPLFFRYFCRIWIPSNRNPFQSESLPIWVSSNLNCQSWSDPARSGSHSATLPLWICGFADELPVLKSSVEGSVTFRLRIQIRRTSD